MLRKAELQQRECVITSEMNRIANASLPSDTPMYRQELRDGLRIVRAELAQIEADRIPPEVLNRLRGFAEVNGRYWKAKLRRMWAEGRDAHFPLLRQARNLIGPSGLDKIKI